MLIEDRPYTEAEAAALDAGRSYVVACAAYQSIWETARDSPVLACDMDAARSLMADRYSEFARRLDGLTAAGRRDRAIEIHLATQRRSSEAMIASTRRYIRAETKREVAGA